MRVTRRRKRNPDRHASAEWVRSIFEELKAGFGLISSCKEKEMVQLARAVRHVERYSATDTRRGRPSRWPREDLVRIGSRLNEILSRETDGRISVATFVDHYLRILDFPTDVLEALSKADVNLFEAEQLARVTAKRLDISPAAARRKRAEMLAAHAISRSSGERLRRRINELLNTGRPQEAGSSPRGGGPDEASSLEDFDPYDSTHLFWEEIKQLGFAFKEIRREDLTDELIEELLHAAQPLWSVIAKIQRRKQQPPKETLIF
jgi:hypothetical protein